ncbi:RHS repeat domain-containing protein, partial [Alistipes communis]|uniref:RHS repeat domain-containing protein n=1 Tax=Alistipes communis TaxID=2585118 RepID=UPI002430AA7D
GRVQEQSLAVEAELIPIRSQAGVSIGEPIESVEPPYLGASAPLRKYVYDTYPSEVQAAGLDFQPIEGLTATDGESLRYDNATGSLTYEKLAVLANDTISGYHQRACYYDYKGRVIQTVERDTEDGILCTSQRYDFVGNLIAQRESYTRAGKTDDIDRTFTYDDRGRLLSETTQVNGGEEAVVYYEYDELGRLAARRLGEGTSAIAEQSEYDIRSWLTAKSSELFDMSLGHSYTGNITSWQWQHKGDPSGDGPQNRYEFTYDDLSRLTNTDQYVNGELNKQNVERFLTYDRNGNLLTLIRYADGVQSSNRQYTYIGNRLDRMEKDRVIAWDEIEIHPGGPAIVVPEKVTEDNGTAALDAGISIDTSAVIRPVDPGIILHSRYAHDRNGNLTYDMELQTNFAYNSLNLLEKAMRNDTIVAKYSYLADGTKLSAVNADDCGFAYRGSFTYRMDAEADRVFESTPFGGGRIVATAGNDTEIRYFLTDHLESVRVVATDQNNVLERNDYYPFGKRWNSASLPISDNRDHFNGKEDQVFIGDCLADYGARCYNKLNGRWLSQDPLQQYHSPYVFCGNNPIRLIDLDGMEARDSTSVMIPPVIVYPSEDGEGGGHSNSFWWSLIPGYSLYEAYEAFSDGEYKSGFKNGLYGTIDIGLCFIPVSKLSNLYKVGKNLKKATSISRILPQFSNSTIERAVQKMMRNKDKIDFHIFVPKHKLENVVNTLGGKENTIRQALIELNGKLPVSGKFEATIELGGSQVTVRGYVVDGLPDIGTMFVPK